METLKKIACLLALLLWAGAIICGLTLFIQAHRLVPIISFILIAAMSVPSVKVIFDYFTENGLKKKPEEKKEE